MEYLPYLTKVFLIGTIAFILAIAWTPLLSNFLYKYKIGKNIRRGQTPLYTKLHQKKAGTPTMGGVLIWLTILFLAVVLWLLNQLWPNSKTFSYLNFLSRPQTLLPLGALVASGLVGAIDDLFDVFKKGGIRFRYRLLIHLAIAIFGAWWFYYKLGWNTIHIPAVGDFTIGWWYLPLFILVIVSTAFAVNETDGLDGLAGGTLLMAFASFGVIAFAKGKIDLAVFCAAVAGALLAFLWFNVYPARFFMGDTGAMGLGVTLGIIAMLTNSVLVLPIFGFIFVIEALSVIIQLFSKKFFKRKIFLISPLHHHYEAKGWPETKVTMRFWIISAAACAVGLIVGLIGGGNPMK